MFWFACAPDHLTFSGIALRLARRCNYAAVASAFYLLLAIGASPVSAKPHKDQPSAHARARACPWTPVDADAIDEPQSQLDAENKNNSDEDDDDEGHLPAGDSASDAGPGFYFPISGCILIDGSVATGPQTSSLKTDGSVFGQPSKQVSTQFSVTAATNFTHYVQTELGVVVTRLGIETDQNNAVTLPYASVLLGNAIFGLQTSFYSGWQADEFSFRALTPSQSPMLAAYTFRPSRNFTASLSLEDQTARRATLSGYGPSQYPDVIGRLRYSIGKWQLQAMGGLHQTTFASSLLNPALPISPPIWGAAAQGYARYALPNDRQDDKSYLILQLGYANRAPGFLGINNPTSAFKINLPAALGAFDAERAVGWNGAAVASWAWSDKWRSAAFATTMKLRMPDVAGSIVSRRSAINLTYTPVENLDFTLEAGVAKVSSKDAAIPSASQLSLIFAVSRSFP